MNAYLLPRLMATLTLLALAACTTDLSKRLDKETRANQVEANSLVEQGRQGTGAMKPEVKGAVQDVGEVWLPFKKEADIEAQTAAKKTAERRISVNRSFRNIQEVAERLTVMTKMPVNVSPDALETQAGPQTMPQASGQFPTQGPVIPGSATGGIPGLPPLTSAHMNGAVLPSFNPAVGTVSISYEGTLSGFLDVVAARFGLSWAWGGNNSINIFRYTTKTFRLVALPGDSTSSNTIAGTTSGATSSSGVSISGLSVWSAVDEAVKSMLSAKGKVTVSAATGTVTVTDTPLIVEQVGKYIDAQNTSLGKQVMVNVRVLSVDMNDADNYGINWQALYTSLSRNFNIGLGSNFAAPTTNTGTISFNVLGATVTAAGAAAGASSGTTGSTGPATGSAQNANLNAWQTSNAVISALSQQGKISQVTATSLVTMNNQPVPLQVGRQIAYLASSATTVTEGAGTTTTLTPGSVSTGFSMSLVPHILEKGRLLLQFAINISSLNQISTVSSGGANPSQIQTPDIDTSNFMQRVMIQSGDTLIMTGFEQTTLNSQSQGIGSPSNYALGGSVNRTRDHNVVVILVQPLVGEM
jgi:hypothetical protein